MLEHIPPEASVTTTSQISAHLGNREKIYIWPIPFQPADWVNMEEFPKIMPEYVMLDTSYTVVQEMDALHDTFIQEVRTFTETHPYRPVVSQDGYIIYQRNDVPP